MEEMVQTMIQLDGNVYGYTDLQGRHHPCIKLNAPPDQCGKELLAVLHSDAGDPDRVVAAFTAVQVRTVWATRTTEPGQPHTYWTPPTWAQRDAMNKNPSGGFEGEGFQRGIARG